jgi:hypothetical protein
MQIPYATLKFLICVPVSNSTLPGNVLGKF